jgi:hypothetical protein
MHPTVQPPARGGTLLLRSYRLDARLRDALAIVANHLLEHERRSLRV